MVVEGDDDKDEDGGRGRVRMRIVRGSRDWRR